MKTIPLIIQFKLYGVPFKLPLTPVRAADINTFQWLLLDDIKESCKAKLILHPKMCGETPTWEEDYNKKGQAK